MNEPIFLLLDEVLRLHALSLAEHGGAEGTREPGLVDSALASAENTFHYGKGDLFDIAASYALHIAESQAFLDGNKRTAGNFQSGFSRKEWRLCSAAEMGTLSGDD